MRRALSVFAWIVAAMMAMPLAAVPALADGGLYRYIPVENAWYTASERAQFGIINFDAGQEKLILSIQVEAADLSPDVTKAAWIFPIPSDPPDVTLDHLALTPRMDGEPINRDIAKDVSEDPAWVYCILCSQLYLAPIVAPSLLYVMTLGIGGPGGLGDQVTTFDKMEKYGVTSEVISAETSDALYSYIQGKGIDLPSTAKGVLADYIGRNYSLVLSQITDLDYFRSSALAVNQGGTLVYVMGIKADFPSKDIFFPLKLTSVYEDAQIPIVVQVMGSVQPVANPSPSSNLRMSVSYSIQERYDIPDQSYYWQYYLTPEDVTQLRGFFEEQLNGGHSMQNVHYTTVTFSGSAGALNEDLWMSDTEPLAVTGAKIIKEHPFLLVILIFVIVSCLSGLITGAWLHRGGRSELFAVVGLANLLTLIGVWIAYDSIVKPRLVVNPWAKKKSFVWSFSLIYLILSGSAYGLVYLAARI